MGDREGGGGQVERGSGAGEGGRRPVGLAFVTGGTGFLGSHVVEGLLEAGYRVRCLVRDVKRIRWLEGLGVELVDGALEAGDLRRAVRGAGAVFHFAGLTRGRAEELWRTNVEGTRDLVSVCADESPGTAFIYCSSQAAAGPGDGGRPRHEDDPAAPTTDYGRTKLAAEREVLARGDRVRGVVLRPVAVYGPRDRDTLPYFRMAARGFVVVPGLRERRFQMVHARDVAVAARLAAERETVAGRRYFVADPELVTWRELADAMGRALGRTVRPLPVPSPVLRAAGALAELGGLAGRKGVLDRRRARDLTERDWTCTVDAAIAELGWSPALNLELGLADTFNWYRSNGWL